MIKTGAVCTSEKNWILKVFFNEFFGIEYRVTYIDKMQNTTITLKESKKQLSLDDSFFHLAAKNWLKPESLPKPVNQFISLQNSNLHKSFINKKTPILYGKPNIDDISNTINFDIFGTAFFMLSLYEEAIVEKVDSHGRFSGDFSFLVNNQLIDRPIINEYLEILWFYLNKTWPELQRKKRLYRKIISCDVDYPYSPGAYNILRAFYQGFGDIKKRKSPKTAIKSFINPVFTFFNNYSYDPYNKFQWMMDLNEKNNNIITFNFIADHSAGIKDGIYSINESRIIKLLENIHIRGHEIGIHFSYNTYQDKDQLVKEYKKLTQVLEKNHIHQSIKRSRQHYLRWDSGTASKLNDTGITHDSTVGFADYAGFRCGICYEYSMYDVHQRKELSIKQNPLVTMEATVISYMKLGYTKQAFDLMLSLKDTCRHYQGDYTLLWHNSHFLTKNDAEFYEELIR